jgi:hypothetical protein
MIQPQQVIAIRMWRLVVVVVIVWVCVVWRLVWFGGGRCVRYIIYCM